MLKKIISGSASYYRHCCLIVTIISLTSIAANAQNNTKSARISNPIIPGDFADPCVLLYKDTVYIYATAANIGSVWRSADMINWKLTKLNWPTSMRQPDVWAPAVRQATDGNFYLYTSVNHQIYAGVAKHPLGPFKNILGDSVFIKDRQYWPKIHSIDADCFIDNDGQAYLYWGSGWDFKDGVCAVGRLNKDMASFKEKPVDITPAGYFEGPHMLRYKNKYYLMYSDGIYFNDSYKVRYAIGDSPTGPFVQASNSPILTSNLAKHVSGPGHHFTIKLNGQHYIVYHKHTYPFKNGQRQVCIDKLDFDDKGLIKPVITTDAGVNLFPKKRQVDHNLIKPVQIKVSADDGSFYKASYAADQNFGTRWLAPVGKDAFLEVDLGKIKKVTGVEPIFDSIMGSYDYTIEYSANGTDWTLFATAQNENATEWPVRHSKRVNARHVRINIKALDPGIQAGLWELNIYQ
ncbi:hypothetical protein DJ568_09405 [Mucilaginibacter hurinus]|uniref:F5/8 type C domain-containing protein n=1 Tax=Mucilaginibacter hurinus TaxID=2201324 RepID=A0A367GML6_9SPHI|nr:family 43 glycosylhydrolase [Mucilaginibacter hurinus]RCH54699.1 hypothetical protein DJ568_09405 [Mucilaginibacter hurinus]